MNASATLQKTYAERREAARAWKARGGKVVGYFEDNVPEELIIAAGFLPYRLSGDPGAPWQESMQRYVYPYWKKHTLSERQVVLGFINSMLDLVFRGEYEFVDYLVIPYSRKMILGIWSQINEARKYHPELKLPEIWFLDRAMTPSFNSSIFNAERVVGFREQLAKWSGKDVSDASLKSAIDVTNRYRAGVAALNALRVEARVAGAEALALTGAARFMPLAQYNDLLAEAVKEIATRPARSGRRVFLAGSPQDNDQLYKVIEAAGATVVAENHYWGAPSAYYPVPTDMDPIVAIGDMYHKKPAAVVYPLQRAIDEVVERAKAARADSVVFSVYKNDNHEIWSVPLTREALTKAGLPSLYLHQQPYLLDGTQQADLSSFFKQQGVAA